MKNNLKFFLFSLLFLSISSFSNAQIDTTGVNELFEMSLTDLMNQEVVTASKFVQRSAETASSISVITSEEIYSFNYTTLGEALNSQRGMYLSNDRNYLYVGSRGFSRPTDYNNRIVIMIDGHILNEIVYGSAFMGNELGLNLRNVEKIEIIRGPGASLYGSGAMLNIVNIIMKKGSATDGIDVSAGAGNFGKKDISAVFGKKVKDIDISISGSGGKSSGENFYFPEFDAPETNNGISRGMDWEKFGNIQASVSKQNFKISGLYSNRLKGIPTGAFETDLTGDVSSKDSRYYFEANYKKELSVDKIFLFRAYYDDYFYEGTYPAGGVPLFDESQGKWSGAEVQYYYKTGPRNILISGIEYKYVFNNNYKEWDNSEVYFKQNYPFSFFSIYSHDQFSLTKNLTFTGGFRFDQYSLFGHSLSPRAALVYEYSKASSVKFLYSEAFRIPNMYESFYESENSQKSNSNIKPEKIRSVELVWGHRISDQLYGSLSLYHFTMKNLIDLMLDENDGLTQFTNLNKAIGKGFEAELRYKGAKRRSGFINLSLQKANDPDLDKILTNSPQVLIKSGLVFPITDFVNVAPEFFYESGRYTLAGNKTSNVYLFNLSVRTRQFLRHFDVALKATNLFDRKYYYPGGFEHLQDVLPQDRRNFFIQLNARF